MASYKITPLTHGKFRVDTDDGKSSSITTGPYDSEVAARAYIEEHSRMAKASDRWARTNFGTRRN